MHTITVAICTWNRAASLERTLESLTTMVVPPSVDLEILVIDNASTDLTSRVIEQFAGRLPLRGFYEAKSGLSSARNRALREAAGDLILWTDDDVLVDSGWLAALVDACARWNADVVFGRSRPLWLGGRPSWYSDVHAGRFALLDYGDAEFVADTLVRPFYGLNFATRRTSLLALGGFNETLGYVGTGGDGGEDTELFRRALASQMRVVYVPGAVVSHTIDAIRGTKAFYRKRLRGAAESNYRDLAELLPNVPWLCGLPRFMYRDAFSDVVRYVRSVVSGASDQRFACELRLLKFALFVRAASRRSRAGGRQGRSAVPDARRTARPL